MPPSLFVRYKAQWLLILTTLVVSALYWQTIDTLLFRWLKFDEAYGHGLLIIMISAYLIGSSQFAFTPHTNRERFILISSLASLCCTWFVFAVANITLPQQLLFPLILFFTFGIIFGSHSLKLLTFPIFFLYFAIPFWDQFNDFLVQLTVIAVEKMLFATNIAAHIQGNLVEIENGKFLVAGGCSGLRYLIVGSALSFLLAHINNSTNKNKLFLICSGILLSTIANWIRVYLLIYIGMVTEMKSSLMHDHDHFGWLVFAIVFCPVYILAHRLNASSHKDKITTTPTLESKTAVSSNLAMTLAVILILISGPLLVESLEQRSYKNYHWNIDAPTDWKQKTIPSQFLPENLPHPKRAYLYQHIKQDMVLDSYILNYRKENDKEKLLPYIRSIYDDSIWTLTSSQEINNVANQGKQAKQIALSRLSSQRKRTVWYWFNVAGISSTSYSLAKLSQIWAPLSKNNNATLFIFSTECQSNCETENKIISSFLEILSIYKEEEQVD